MRKKLKTSLSMSALLLLSIMLFASCDSDEWTAYNLDGDWYGDLTSTTYSGRYGSSDNYYTKMSFTKESTYGGTGYEYDYPRDNSNYYTGDAIGTAFKWYVQDGGIYIKYSDTQWKTFVIMDPSVNSSTFSGAMYEVYDDGSVNENKEIYFNFTRSSYYHQNSGSWRNVQKR